MDSEAYKPFMATLGKIIDTSAASPVRALSLADWMLIATGRDGPL